MNARHSLFYVLAVAAGASATAGDFPEPKNTGTAATRPLRPAEAAAGFRVPDGFRVNVFAAEPDVRNPIAMAWDPRGRLWVAENYTYSDTTQVFDMSLRDRVLVFEDLDGDGRFDKRKVFTDDVQRLASVELGLGGVWLLCPPQLLFVPDRDGDDVPDGPAEVKLDGFNVPTENYHTFANGLRWGPDGWLYGRCGASSPGEIGAPGTPDDRRIPVRGGLWRYHPKSGHFEVLTHGTTNPWGHDWDADGEAFFVNTVIGHLWHLIPGAHLARPHTIEPNPRVYSVIDQHADHYHWDNSRAFRHETVAGGLDDTRGGGHAHTGATIYQGGQWPDAYRGKMLTLNFHGRRLNVERLERSGGGFLGRHEPDAFFATDPWFRPIDLGYGPDGSVFALDWSDTGECHEHDGVQRTSGRIYRIAHGSPKRPDSVDLTRLDNVALVALHARPNEWFTRQARRVLADRAALGDSMVEVNKLLRESFEKAPDPSRRMRALFTLYTLGGADDAFLRHLLDDPRESIRTWGVRFLTDAWPIDTVFSRRGGPDVDPLDDLIARFQTLAASDPSGLVRMALASALQRLPVARRASLAKALAGRSEDAADPNIPPLVWTGLIPLADSDPSALADLAIDSKLPDLTRWTARRLGEEIEARPDALNRLLEGAAGRTDRVKVATLAGLAEALVGWRKAAKPAVWEGFRKSLGTSPETADRARDLDVLFGDGRALDEVRRLALDHSASLDARISALRTLVASRPTDLREVCERLISVRFLNAVALPGLVLFDGPEVGRLLAANYKAFHPSERPLVMSALASRPAFARVLLDRIAEGKIPRQDLNAFQARQIRSLGDAALTERLAQVWGEFRESPADRRVKISDWKARLDPAALASADRGRGRAVFDRVCASCHKLYGHGGAIGPDLTGSGRDNLDYVLENLIDPGASVGADYRMVVVSLADGRVLNGLVKARTDRTLTLQTQTEALVLDRADVEAERPSPSSLMPEGLIETLKADEVRDLVSYLMSRTQVPLSSAPGR